MIKIVLILFVTMFSLICQSQTDSIIKKDSSKFILTPSDFYSFKIPENNFVPALNYSSKPKNCSSRYSLYYDSLNTQLYIYDNCIKKYFYYGSIYPYHSIGSSLIDGTLNYLFLLFDKKREGTIVY